MITADLIREARTRADLSQAALAHRVGCPQSTIARWERGTRTPSLETAREVIRACGLELGFGLARYDDSYDALVDAQLALPPAERLRVLVGPAAVARLLADLQGDGALGVLVGPVAEVLRGSPLAPATPLRARFVVDPADANGGGAAIEHVTVVPGSTGVRDLRRDASPVALGPGLDVTVASLRDLVRIAEADPDSRGRTPALRVTLERSPRA